MMSVNVELKPCPFCGSDARIQKGKRIKHRAIRGHRYIYMIGCSNHECILHLSDDGKARLIWVASKDGLENMIKRWNRRKDGDDVCHAQMKDDTISRQAALDALGEEPLVWHDDAGEMAERNQWRRDVAAIKALPSAQKRGEWIERSVVPVRKSGIDEVQSAKCSVCGRYHTTPYLYFFRDDNYCPYCGATMERGTDE